MTVSIGNTILKLDDLLVERDGTTHRMTRQAAEIIRVLLEQAGSVVTKDLLIERVWGGRIVTDATLSTAMKEARRAIGDNGRAQRIIKTVHGVGFRLVQTLADTPTSKGDGSAPPRVAVLPFRSLGLDAEDAFISDGLTDDLIARLSLFRDLMILARRTTEVIAEKNLDLQEMRRRYNVDFCVEGSLRQIGERLRFTVQVASTRSGALLVTEQSDHDATPQGMLDLQDHVSLLCAGRLASPHGPMAREATARSWDMYRLISEFRRFSRSYDPALHLELRAQLPKALEREPNVSEGWAAFAMVLLEEHRFHFNERANVDALALARDAADRAVAADPRNAFSRTALAMCRLYSQDHDGFDDAAKRALDLNPGNADVLAGIAYCNAILGREHESIALFDRAIELSPEHPGWYHVARTWRYMRKGHHSAAMVELQKFPMPGFYWYHAHMVWLNVNLGDMDAARAEAAILRQVYPSFENRVHEELALWQSLSDLLINAIECWSAAGLVVRHPARDNADK